MRLHRLLEFWKLVKINNYSFRKENLNVTLCNEWPKAEKKASENGVLPTLFCQTAWQQQQKTHTSKQFNTKWHTLWKLGMS